MAKCFLLSLFLVLGWFSAQAALAFDWKGTSTMRTASTSWTGTDGSGDCPGPGGRTTDIMKFAMTSTFISQPTISSGITTASLGFSAGFQKDGVKLPVNVVALMLSTTARDISIAVVSFTIFDYLRARAL